MKKIIIFTLLFLLIIPNVISQREVKANNNIEEIYIDYHEISRWKQDAVNYLYEKEIMQGDNGYFYPNRSIMRGEIAKILAVSLGLPIPDSKSVSLNFSDMKEHWASPYVQALQLYNPAIISGYADGTFKPNQEIRKDELAKILVTAFKLEGSSDFSVNYSDIDNWAKPYIEAFVISGFEINSSNNAFYPDSKPVREDVATYIYKSLEKNKRTSPMINTALTMKAAQVNSTITLNTENKTVYLYGELPNQKLFNGIKYIEGFTEEYYDKNKHLVTSGYFYSDDVAYFKARNTKTGEQYIFRFVPEEKYYLEDDLVIAIDENTTLQNINKKIFEHIKKNYPDKLDGILGLDLDSYIYNTSTRLYYTTTMFKNDQLYNVKDKGLFQVDGFEFYINSIHFVKK